MKRLLPLLCLVMLVSCVYTGRSDMSAVQRMGGEGKAVVTIDTAALRESGAAALLPDNELAERVERLSAEISPSDDGWDITVLANGYLSSTEVGTFLIWDPSFVRADGSPRHYVSRSLGVSAGVPEDGMVLVTTADYSSAYRSLFRRSVKNIADSTFGAMESALASVWVDEPESLPPLGADIPEETVRKISSILLFINDGENDSFSLSGEIRMDGEESARTLCTLLRNLLVQEIRRSGERLDVKAISGIFTYEGSVLRISGCSLSYDTVGAMLTKEL